MEISLTDRIALVTGTGSQIGFGKGIAATLARCGCNIISCDINLEGAEQTASFIKSLGRDAISIKVDVTKMNEVEEMVKNALKKFGKIDILVNNAGGAVSFKPFVDTPVSVWEKVINLNLYGTLNCTKAVLPHMIQRQRGKIINIVSGAGITGTPNFALYGASKGAVIAFVKGLSREVISSGINVNNIAPGIGDTNFLKIADFPSGELEKAITAIPSGKATTPDDIGNMVAYLATDLANNIVGQTFVVDGGLTVH